MHITPLPLLKDNYAYVLQDPESSITAVIDPSEASPVIDFLNTQGLTLDYILTTHHHWDHTNGNLELKKKYKCQVIGFFGDKERIPGIDKTVQEGDVFMVGSLPLNILHIPGHTLGHIAYYCAQKAFVFTGDTLFSIGCGRCFEGTPQQLWRSLQKLRDLPAETRVYCGHEYTEANLKFALSLEPHNKDLKTFQTKMAKLRGSNKPSVPSTIGIETHLNPFLRADDPNFVQKLDFIQKDPISIFTTLRHQKDHYL